MSICDLRFNTSHVTLYPFEILSTSKAVGVSIHLMLLFIERCSRVWGALHWFQYISCYSLSVYRKVETTSSGVSIHLMLLFIAYCGKDCWYKKSVSIHLMLLFILIWLQRRSSRRSFNTSHVTLYPLARTIRGGLEQFQYISCYSLSIPPRSEFLAVLGFQYISCYSLSLVL